MNGARKTVSDVSEFGDKRVQVSTQTIRRVRFLVEKASRAIHSNASIHREDKKMMLGILKAAKEDLDSILQLDMFSQAQLK